MGFLTLLKSPKIIGMIVGGLALIGLLWSWHSRGQEIETLESKLALCDSQRQGLELSNDQLAADIEHQNAEIEALAAEVESRKQQVEEAQREAERLQEATQTRIDEIMALTPTELPESTTQEQKELSLCRDAESVLRSLSGS